MKQCKFRSCTGIVIASGYCSKHYRLPEVPVDLEFIKNQCIEEDFGYESLCWIWQKERRESGYGVISIDNKKHIRVHRVSFKLKNGYFPKKPRQVNHLCNGGSGSHGCVNPFHLEDGTNQDNMNDKVRAGRQSRLPGELNGRAKIWNADIPNIRNMLHVGFRQEDIADIFGVKRNTIGNINTGTSWKHV